MNTNAIVIIVGALVVLALVVLLLMRQRRTARLRGQFGPEYARAVDQSGGRRQAEAELVDRTRRVRGFSIKPLQPGERERYGVRWRAVQADFVDNPKGAVTQADTLLGEIMAARGYPTGDFEQQSADLSVDHPVFVQNYRAAHDIALRHERGEASTEDMRQAMIHYRALFDDLVSDGAGVVTAKAS